MRNIVLLIALFALLGSCRESTTPPENIAGELNTGPAKGILFAGDIIYDVLVKAETDDPWLNEMVAGYSGEGFINSIFDAVYNGTLEVYDYHSGEKLTSREVKSLESKEEYSRSNIGKIQFTEDWYYSESTGEIEKVVKSLVFGYRINPDELDRVGYLAVFEIKF